MKLNNSISKHICKYCAYYDYETKDCLNYKDITDDVEPTDGEDCELFDLNKYWFDRLERVYNLDIKLQNEYEPTICQHDTIDNNFYLLSDGVAFKECYTKSIPMRNIIEILNILYYYAKPVTQMCIKDIIFNAKR